jgi:hypothetical protein
MRSDESAQADSSNLTTPSYTSAVDSTPSPRGPVNVGNLNDGQPYSRGAESLLLRENPCRK